MISTAIRIPRSTVVHATKNHTATIFFFHGSGSNGEDLKQWVDILNRSELKFPHIKLIYPSAPIQPYTPNNGMPSCVWFDRKGIDVNLPEVKESVNIMCERASELIDKEVTNGIPYNRIIVCGFSMGGSLSLMLAYRFRKSIAGCCSMSSFLNHDSAVYESLRSNQNKYLPDWLQFHGDADTMVPIEWAMDLNEKLRKLGVASILQVLNNVDHEIVGNELEKFKEWAVKLLPDKQAIK